VTQTGWRLERTYLAGAGFRESRLEGLDIRWSDPLEPTGHAALWADNGTGKTTITALRFALYLPDARDFIRGGSDRSLAKLVHSGDVCHVVEQATRVIGGELQRIVVGFVAQWVDGTQDLDNPSKLQRFFYGWVSGEHGPSIDSLPFRTGAGRWATRGQFVDALRGLLPGGGALPPHVPAEHQGRWRDWLVAAGVDLEQVRFQTVMNAAEGGVDRVMRFHDSDAFVSWLIGAITPTSTVEQIRKSIDVLRANAAARPRWADELELWQRLTDPLLGLAVAHEEVAAHRRALATAEANAAAIVADADTTIAALCLERDTAVERQRHHDQRRRESAGTLRRAQAHRLRMQMRAAHLRAEAAQATAEKLRGSRDQIAATLAAWQVVADVLDATAVSSQLAGLTERLEAAEKETATLQQDERRHRRDLARLLTDTRDRAADRLRDARREQRAADNALASADEDLRVAVAQHATAMEKTRQADKAITAAEQVIAQAGSDGLIDEGADPATVDKDLEERVRAARKARSSAEAELRGIGKQIGVEQRAESDARQRAATARGDAADADRQLREVIRRVDGLTGDPRLVDAVGDVTSIDLWAQRITLTDILSTYVSTADADAAAARTDVTAAQRILDSVGADGLLPSAALAEDAARRCRDHAAVEIPAWPGWRWLADTMAPDVAAAFAAARPEIASGVVVAHRDLVAPAVAALSDLDLDVALWVGAVTDTAAAAQTHTGAGTHAQVLLPHPGIFDRQAARDMLDSATQALAAATERLTRAATRATNTRDILAALSRLWTDLPDDPRPEYTQRRNTANARRAAAEAEQDHAAARLAALEDLQTERETERDTAQRRCDDATDKRRLLAPVISAATALHEARGQLPALRTEVTDTGRRVTELTNDRPRLAAAVTTADGKVRESTRHHEDAAEKLRAAGLSPTADGPVPGDDEATIRARLASVTDALARAAIDPRLHQQIQDARQHLSNLNAKLDADRIRRQLAEQLAVTDAARHPVALSAAIETARQHEASAREEYAKANAAAERATADYNKWAADTADKSSPDVEGFPPAVLVANPDDADRHADQLDDLAAELLNTQRAEERQATGEGEKAQKADLARQLVDASVKPLRHLGDGTLTGRRWPDTDDLINRIAEVSTRLRDCATKLTASDRVQQATTGAVRQHANGPHARKVEEAGDPRVIDLLTRLRADNQLPTEAERLAEQLEQRAATLRDDLNNHDQRVRTCATMLHVQAATAMDRLRAYQNQSRLPEGLGDWSQRQFVIIDHEPLPDDESVAIDRVARVVHALLTPQASRSDAQSLLFGAARALVDASFRVRILKPHTDLSLDRVDVAELKNFSGGQRVTAGVLLYATMTRVRATADATSIGWLWLDNPFGQASADQFVRTMRRAADQLGLQLLFTAAPKDKGALSMFDRTIMLARRHRPSSKENVVVIDDGSKDVVDLTLIQRDVAAVLGG
jgi:hypothetical protein